MMIWEDEYRRSALLHNGFVLAVIQGGFMKQENWSTSLFLPVRKGKNWAEIKGQDRNEVKSKVERLAKYALRELCREVAE